MEKQTIRQQVKYELEWDGSTEIDNLISDLNKLKELGATHLEIDHYSSYDCSYLNLTPFFERQETDEEADLRIKKENERLEQQRKYDLEQLERLKAKYENK